MREVVEAADPAALDGVVPATPEWRVHDVLAHLVGVTDDVVNGRLDGHRERRVDAGAGRRARRDVPTAELLAEWDELGPQFEAMLAAAPAEIAGQALFDAATHEHDLRNALGVPGARDSDAVDIGLGLDRSTPARATARPRSASSIEAGEQSSGVGDVGRARRGAPLRALPRGVGPAHRRRDRGLRLGPRARPAAPARAPTSSRCATTSLGE